MQLFGTDLLKTYWAHDVKMTSMRRYVASTSLRRHVPAGNLAPPWPPQYSKPWPPQYSKPSYAYDKKNITLGCTTYTHIDTHTHTLLSSHVRMDRKSYCTTPGVGIGVGDGGVGVKFLRYSFLCLGQEAVRQAILNVDRSCFIYHNTL